MPLPHRWPAIIVALAIAIAPAILPSSMLTLLNYVGLNAMVCLGLVLLTGVAGLTSFGQAAFVGLGAYAAAYLSTVAGWAPIASLPPALLAAGVVALALGSLTIALSSHYLVLGTIAWGLSLFYLMGNLPFFGGYNGLSGVPSLFDGPWRETGYYTLIWISVLVFLALSANLLDSRSGRAMRSLKDGLMARSFGIDVNRMKLLIFVLAALMSGYAGWIQAHYVSIVNPGPFGMSASIDYLFMAVVGGTANIAGAVVGPLMVEAIRGMVRNLVPGLTGVGGSAESMIFGMLIIALMMRSSTGGAMALITRWLPEKPPKRVSISTEPLPRRKLPQAGTKLLEVRGLTKQFGGLVAVDAVDLDLSPGEVLGVIGPNGAGKSTLFNLLTGALEPTFGEACLLGERLNGVTPDRIAKMGVARTFQHVRLRGEMTALENVALGCYLRGSAGPLSSALKLDVADEARALTEAQRQLDRVGLGASAQMKANELSLGQQRILEIARALAADPQLLLLDEPAAGLRYREKQALGNLVRQLRQEGIAVLLVEHDMDFVMNLVDRAVVLNFGKRIAAGSPHEVQANPAVIEAYLGGFEDSV